MDNTAKTIANNVLATFGGQAPRQVLSAIQNASAKTGVDFAYMVQQAAVESSFDPEAKAKTSTASGLYQFIDSTWLSMVDKYGPKHGIDTAGKSPQEILALRNDPEISANMAAEFASENEKFLNDHWAKGTKDVGATELYLAHFMGAGSAAAFLNARDENPLQQAALLFPKAAEANRTVFYDTQTGRPKTMDEVYGFFDKKFQIKSEDAPQMAFAEDEFMPVSVSNAMTSLFDAPDHGAVAHNDFFTGSIFKMARPDEKEERPFGSPSPAGFLNTALPGFYQNMIRSPLDLILLTQMR